MCAGCCKLINTKQYQPYGLVVLYSSLLLVLTHLDDLCIGCTQWGLAIYGTAANDSIPCSCGTNKLKSLSETFIYHHLSILGDTLRGSRWYIWHPHVDPWPILSGMANSLQLATVAVGDVFPKKNGGDLPHTVPVMRQSTAWAYPCSASIVILC